MNMGLHKIAINTADLAEGHSIAAYLTDAAGALITSSLVGAKQSIDALDASSHLDGSAYAAGVDILSSVGVVDTNGNWVPFTLNAAGELPVAATVNFAGDYATGSVHGATDVGLYGLTVRRDARAVDAGVADGDYASFSVNAVGELWVKDADALAQLVLANSSLDAIEASVAAIDVDTSSIITELQAANVSLDNIEADAEAIRVELLDQGTTLDAILADTATIDSQTLAIQNLITALSKTEDAAHVSGDQGIQALAVRKDANGSNAADGDYTSLQTWIDGGLKTVSVANGAILQQQVTVGAAAAAVPAAALAGRKTIMIQNTGLATAFIGSASVTTSGATAGLQLPSNSFIELEAGPAVSIFAIRGLVATTLNILEMA